MILIRTIFILLVFIFSLGTSNSRTEDNDLRLTLEKSWYAYLDSHKTAKESELKKTMSSYSLATMKNGLASAKFSLTPDFIRSMGEHIPDIKSYDFVKVLQNGPTAGLVYEKDSEYKDGEGKDQIQFIFIKFVKEDAIWKVDGVMITNKPKFQENGDKAEFSASDISDDFQIDGIVLNAPDPISIPYSSAYIHVLSLGHNTHVILNGISQEETINTSSSGTLIGGLKKGTNNISIIIKSTEQESTLDPKVKILRILDNKEFEDVFLFKPEDNFEGEHSFKFEVN